MLHRSLRLAVFAAVFLLDALRAAEMQPELVIGVYHPARIPPENLRAALVLAHAAFAAAGLETEWRIRDGGPPEPPDDLMLWILPGMATGVASRDALGAAWFEKSSSRAIRAEVFYGAIQEQTQTVRQTVTLLANVIVHEVGHLLLGREHATGGLMGANWSGFDRHLAQHATLGFAPGEAKRLRAVAAQLRTNAALRTAPARGGPGSGVFESYEKRTPR